MTEQIRAPKGLYGVIVTDTGIAKSDADGSLVYRGYNIDDLFERSTFEESAFLVLEGRLPKRRELDEFTERISDLSRVPACVYDIVRAIPKNAHPMDVLRTAVSGLGAGERSLDSRDQQYSLIAKMPTLVANCYRVAKGMDAIEPDPQLGVAANLLYMLGGKVPRKFDSWALERLMILYMEHDVNASAFTVRVVASTLADVFSAATAGLAALKGPLHGGANEAAMKMLLQVGEPENGKGYVQELIATGKKVMGFGHRVYKKSDPRVRLSKPLLKELLEEKQVDDKLYRTCDAIERAMWDEKRIPANVDFYAGPIFYTLSIPVEVFTPIFAASRVVGWVSHYNEQVADNKIFRPDADYVGKKNLSYVPIERR